METGVRQGLCCQKCLAPETAELRLKVCSRCKATHYCSAECQKEHWKEHKLVCNARIESVAKAKDEFGAEFVKAYKTWAQEARAGLNRLVHSVVPPRKLSTHVAYLETHYQPEATPKFKIVSYKSMALAELRDKRCGNLCDAVMEHMKTTLPQLEAESKGSAWGYAVVLCRNAHASIPAARMIPSGVVAGGDRGCPEEIALAINMVPSMSSAK